MATIQVDRNLFGLLVDRWAQADLEVHAYRQVVRRAEQEHPDAAKVFHLLLDFARNDQNARNMEIDSEMGTAWTVQDDEAFLRLLEFALCRSQSDQ